MKDKITKIVLFILIIFLSILLFQNYLLRKSNDRTIKNSGYLPEGTRQEITVKKDKVVIKNKVENKDTGSKEIKTDIKYLPPEGELKVSVKDNGDVSYTLKNKGFTFTPGVIVIPSKETDIGAVVRFVYWNRFGAGTGAVISIEDSPKVGVIGVVDYRFYKDFAIGISYKESFTERKAGLAISYYF